MSKFVGRFGRMLCLGLMSQALLVGSAVAADPARPDAHLKHANEAVVPEEDADYPLLGEYVGWQRARPSTRSSEPIGLQIYCPQPGQFAAVKYYGGLPGSGWFGGERFEYKGDRQGDIVRLHTDDYEYSIEADGKRAKIFAADGRLAGELRKVERVSPTMGAHAPSGAVILFDNKSSHKLQKPVYTSKDGTLYPEAKTEEAYDDFRMHLEFRIPYMPKMTGQNRGNSGVYIQGRYELQVLDSFGFPREFNSCAALYRTLPPRFIMSFPPGQWQTYDIDFTSAKFDDAGNKIADAHFTVWQNGVVVHDNTVIPRKTGNGLPEGPQPLPTKFQNHNSPVEFRNIWILPKGKSQQTSPSLTAIPPAGQVLSQGLRTPGAP